MNAPEIPYRTVDIAVPGGSLRTAVWGESGPVVLCVHGSTANHKEFVFLARELGHTHRLIAPDLRGRGRSSNVTGRWGMAAHAADVVTLLDHFGVARADIALGHSMGGFVCAVAAAQQPQRFAQVLMVDGGLPLFDVSFIVHLPFSDWIIERIVRKVLGPSITRLDMRFASRAAYLDFWRPHPGLKDHWSPEVEAYLDYDLEGEPPQLRPSMDKQALLADSRTQLIEDLVDRSLKAIRCPVRFLRAPRGVFDAAPLYPEKLLARRGARIRDFSVATVPDVNHWTIMMSQKGAQAVAAEVRRMLRDP